MRNAKRAGIAATLGALAAMGLGGCPAPQRPEPERPVPAPAPPPAPAPAPAPTATATLAPPPAPAAPSDYWVNRFGGYMSPAFKAEYLATPPDERFAKYGDRLLDFQRREDALEPYRDRLSRAEIEKYRSLPDYDASMKWLEERFPH
jgi:hypothetical protein